MDTRTNYTVWMKNGGFYIVEAFTMNDAEWWVYDNLDSSWSYCEETKDKDYDEYLNHGHKIYRVLQKLGGQKPYNPKQHIEPRPGPRIYIVDGNRIESLEDLPEGNTTVRVRVVRELNDFPESVHINSAVYGRSKIFAMIEGLIQAKQKIAAIKFVRQFTEWGIMESKNFVDTHFVK